MKKSIYSFYGKTKPRHLLTMHPRPIEIICYHCQQSAEKYLKGYLVLNNHEVVKTHDLVMLNKLCCNYDREFEKLDEECLGLTDYSVNVRYPYPFDLNEEDMSLALEDADRVKKFVLGKINVLKGLSTEETADEDSNQ